MIESIMYFGIGFLFAALIGLVIIPLIHARAVRLTIRHLEDSIPQSMVEIQADKDLLRARFAVSTRRLEMSSEQLKDKTASQLAELGKKGDVINRLKIERDAQNVETILLKAKVEALKEQLTAAGKEMKSLENEHHETDFISLLPKDWPRAELLTAPMNSSQSPTLNDPRCDENQVGDEAKKMIGGWAPPLSQLLSMTKSPQAPASAAAVSSPELVQQLDAMTHDVADMRNRVEQFAAKQEQTGQNIETLQAVEQDIKQKMSSLAPQT